MGKNRKKRPSSELPVTELMERAGENFELNDRRTIAASDSAHKATFGSIDGEDVVVKPFRSKNGSQKALNEFRVTQAAAQAGIPTVEALRVIDLRRERVGLLVSRYIPGLVGAHTLTYEADPDTPKGEAVARAAGSLMSATSRRHSIGITHGDDQPKNSAFLEEEFAAEVFHPIVFDFENGKIASGIHPPTHRFVEDAKEDIKKLSHTLGTRQLGGFDHAVAAEVMRDQVLERYLEGPGAELLGDLATAQVIDLSMASFEAGRQNKSINNIHSASRRAA